MGVPIFSGLWVPDQNTTFSNPDFTDDFSDDFTDDEFSDSSEGEDDISV